MKTCLLNLLFAMVFLGVNAQGTFTFQSTVPVPITDSVTESTLNVETPCTGNDFVVMSIGVDIDFAQTGFLAILINDSVLSNHNGGDGADYDNTVFYSLGTPGFNHIATAQPPFNDTFASELNFDLLSVFPINGPWTLKLLVPSDELVQGSLNSWSISFGCIGSTPTSVFTHADDELVCFPNPASNNVNIKLPEENVVDEALITIYNVQGDEVKKQIVQTKGNACNVDVSELPNGLYSLDFSNGSVNYNTLLSVQH